MAKRGRRAGARSASHGLAELMIVNPHGARGGAGMLLGADGDVYDVRMGAADDRYYLGDDGALYESARTRPRAAAPRYLLAGDGALYAVEWTKQGSGAIGCACGARATCACGARATCACGARATCACVAPWAAGCTSGRTRASIR